MIMEHGEQCAMIAGMKEMQLSSVDNWAFLLKVNIFNNNLLPFFSRARFPPCKKFSVGSKNIIIIISFRLG